MARRDRPDHYARRARREGYQARSVYKLEELQRRFALLRPGMRVLDVGAAPGSWTQLARSIVGDRGRVVAVDRSEIPALEHADGIDVIVGDVFDEGTVERIVAGGPYGAVISDAAPSTSGNRALDTTRSAALVEHVLWLCDRVLAPGGNFAAKIFQGGDEQRLLGEVRLRFATGRMVKPKASRDESFEAFLAGQGYRGTSEAGMELSTRG